MTRDERLLTALGDHDASSAALARQTGLSERVCRYGVRHLIGEGYVWRPERGRYRLTAAGRTIAADILAPGEGELLVHRAQRATPLDVTL